MKHRFAIAFVLIAMWTGTGLAAEPRFKSLRLKADDTMLQLGGAWAEAYHKVRPNVAIFMGGDGPGRTSLNTVKYFDIVLSARPLPATNSVSQ